MKNKAIKFLAYNKKVSVMCIDTTELVEEARKIHDLTPTVTAAAGRALTVAAMMAYLETKDRQYNNPNKRNRTNRRNGAYYWFGKRKKSKCKNVCTKSTC